METTTIQNNSAEIISQAAEKSQEKDIDITQAAIEKIKGEYEKFHGDNKAKAVSSYVSTILQDFCKQDKRFAEVVYKFRRTVSDCCKDILQGVGNHISDIDVYRRAVKFYFPNSEINMNMTISIIGDAPDETEILKEPEKEKAEQKKPAKKKAESKPKTVNRKVNSEQKTDIKKETEQEYIQLSLF